MQATQMQTLFSPATIEDSFLISTRGIRQQCSIQPETAERTLRDTWDFKLGQFAYVWETLVPTNSKLVSNRAFLFFNKGMLTYPRSCYMSGLNSFYVNVS
jgi:hypothetical protein